MANEDARRPVELLVTQCSEIENGKKGRESGHESEAGSDPPSGSSSNFTLSPEVEEALEISRRERRRISDGSRARSASAPLSLQATAIAKELLKVSEKLQVSYEEYKKVRTEVKKKRRRTISSTDTVHLTRKAETTDHSWWRNMVGLAPPPEEGTPV